MNYHVKDAFIICLVLYFSSLSSSYAYIDPGSGAAITTAILGFFAAIGYAFRKYYYKIRNAIRRQDPEKSNDEHMR